MRTIRRGVGAIVVAAAACWTGEAMAAPPPKPTPAQQCEAAKNRAAGTKAQCRLQALATALPGKQPSFVKCETAFTKAFAKAERDAGPGVCPTEGDTTDIEKMVDVCMDDIASRLAGSPPPSCASGRLPATGQTTCYTIDDLNDPTDCVNTTGEDGNVRAGGALSYTDNGDGTITDNNTGLVWERKGGPGTASGAPYTWADTQAYIARLNTSPCLAGHCDWRLPTLWELLGIMNYEYEFPAVSAAFNTGCFDGCSVATCSCTGDGWYWSSTVNGGVWIVGFNYDVAVFPIDPSLGSLAYVRAVRPGS
jgi:hypothetical protein